MVYVLCGLFQPAAGSHLKMLYKILHAESRVQSAECSELGAEFAEICGPTR